MGGGDYKGNIIGKIVDEKIMILDKNDLTKLKNNV